MSLVVAAVAALVATERSFLFITPLLLWKERAWDRRLVGTFLAWWAAMAFVSVYSRVAVACVCVYSLLLR